MYLLKIVMPLVTKIVILNFLINDQNDYGFIIVYSYRNVYDIR
jgi:hypothetical protein